MTDLGSMSLRDYDSVAEARKKILGLVQALGGTEVLATRAATAVSEAARRALATSDQLLIRVSLSRDDAAATRLQLELLPSGPPVDATPLRLFFDRVSSPPGPSASPLTAELDLPTPGPTIDDDLISRERDRILRKSRTELMDELHAKNQQLERYNESLEATVAARTAELRLANTRMQRDLDAGSAYVRALIPPPMDRPVTIGWKYVPSSNLGGDTIGYHWIDDDHLSLYLIDVTGHGLDSALLAVTVTNVIRSQSLPSVDMKRPDQVIASLNEAFQGDQHGLKYFTAWYGVYNPRRRHLTWSGGGHHPALLLTPGNSRPLLLESGGPIIGCTTAMDFPADHCDVPPSSRFLLFSDGVFEILRDDKVVWDLHGAIDFISRWTSSPDSLLDPLLSHVQSLRGTDQLDDDFSIIEAFFP